MAGSWFVRLILLLELPVLLFALATHLLAMKGRHHSGPEDIAHLAILGLLIVLALRRKQKHRAWASEIST